MATILLVEDDPVLSEQIRAWLGYEGHQVDRVGTGVDALARLASTAYNVVILDWNLPDEQGVNICRRFRASGGHAPILMLSAKQDVDDKATALDAGADDYLPKPFHPKELSARLSALQRRPARVKSSILEFGGIRIDQSTHKLLKEPHEISLPPREYSLLELFFENPTRVFSADEIIERLWSAESDVSTAIVKVYINKLRKRLIDSGANVELRTTRGAGYQLAVVEPKS